MIDVHCDETDDVQSRFLELLNALVLMEGIGKRQLPAIHVLLALPTTVMPLN